MKSAATLPDLGLTAPNIGVGVFPADLFADVGRVPVFGDQHPLARSLMRAEAGLRPGTITRIRVLPGVRLRYVGFG